jgi:hypothetical protein
MRCAIAMPACLPSVQWFVAHDDKGKERAEPWTGDLLSIDGKHAASKYLDWLKKGQPGYVPENKAGRKPQETMVSAAPCFVVQPS